MTLALPDSGLHAGPWAGDDAGFAVGEGAQPQDQPLLTSLFSSQKEKANL